MALDPGSLNSAVLAFMGATNPTTLDAANALADVYDAYAAGGLFGASVPTLTGRKSLFASALAGGLAAGNPLTAALALSGAVAAFWGTSPAPIPVVGAQVGTVNGCPGAAAIPGALAAMLAIPNTKETSAATLAGVLHTATLTVTANVAPPPGTVLSLL